MLVGSRPGVIDWNELKSFLRLSYGDQKFGLFGARNDKNEKTDLLFVSGKLFKYLCRSLIASKLKSFLQNEE